MAREMTNYPRSVKDQRGQYAGPRLEHRFQTVVQVQYRQVQYPPQGERREELPSDRP
jgi:hypothetical protein